MKKLLVAGIGSINLRVFNTENVNATIYTYIKLHYNILIMVNSTLSGRITFDDTHGLSKLILMEMICNFSGFITAITFDLYIMTILDLF